MLNDAEIALLARELKLRSGALLTPEMAKSAIMRLTPLARRENFATAPELIAAARIRPDASLWNGIADALAPTETRFFRDRALFARLREEALPAAAARRGDLPVRIWSAGCSTGQEAYSLAILIDEMRAEGRGVSAEIFATDFSERLLEKARSGLYTQFEAQRGLPIRKLIAHFEKSGDLWRISDRMRAAVRFEARNLLGHATDLGPFDLVLCCNVLPGLDEEVRGRVFERIASTLAPGGVMALGAGEALPAGADGFQMDGNFVSRAAAARSAA
jgi:chemotaxis protein methyltransferase CheR